MEHLKISPNDTILDGFKQMDEVKHKLLLLYDGDTFKSLLTIGDLQRALLSGYNVDTAISEIPISDKVYAYSHEDQDKIEEKFASIPYEYVPVLNENNEVVDIIYWGDVNQKSVSKKSGKLKGTPVVVMAGGKGTRLKPITNVIPKPLIPTGEKAIAHDIMDRLAEFGASDFLFSVNYKAQMIEDYFNDVEHPYNIEYFLEQKPMGTAGSLSLMKENLKSTFFISNCDIIIEDDYGNMMEYHRENNNSITVIASLKTYEIPYGIMTRTEDGNLDEFQEKPTNTYMVSTGMYILEPEVLEMVPDDTFFHITELIEKVKKSGRKVGIFPVSEASWKDIGEWPSYLKNYVQL